MADNEKTAPAGGTVVRGAAAAKQFMVPTNKTELISYLEKKKDEGRPLTPRNQMKLNMAFVLGYQWVTWDHRMRAYRRPTIDIQDPNTPVRISANKIGGFVERTIAKLTKTLPEPECRPVSDDDNDVDAARVGTRILNHELDRLGWDTYLQKFLFWPCSIGWGYLHPWWNPDAGDSIGVDPDDPEEGDIMEGEVCIDIVAPFDLHVDPSAETMAQANWAVRTTTMTKESAWEKFGVELTGGGLRSLTHEVLALGSTGQVDPAHPQENWVNVFQFWMRPCRSAPQGRCITWANQEVLEDKPFPYNHRQLPFVQCDLIPGYTREGRTWVTDLIPLQTDYNDTLSREATIRRQLTPKFIGAVGQIDPQRITARVETLLYMPGVAATPPHLDVPNGAWAQQFEQGMARDEADMADRAGINEASSGKAPATGAAASIMALQEADDTKMFLTATALSQFIQNVGWQILMLCKQYWKEERSVRVWSSADAIAAYRYQGSDIDQKLDIHVSAESALPRSKAARIQLVLELQQRFPNLFDPQTVMTLLDVPGTDEITRHLDDDTRLQKREISQLLAGEEPVVQPFHNHVIHLKELNAFRRSLDYERLADVDKARFDAHAAVHEMLVLRQTGVQIPEPNPTMDPVALQQAAQVAAGPAGQYMPGSAPAAPPTPAPAQQQGGSGMTDQALAQAANIGQGAGSPGRVPNIPVDNQAAAMGQ